jgi:hypothetical protein
MKYLKKIINKIKLLLETLSKIDKNFDDIKINQGIIISNLNKDKSTKSLKDCEFKVFSQWGEDGIIQYLTQSIDIKNRTFIGGMT